MAETDTNQQLYEELEAKAVADMPEPEELGEGDYGLEESANEDAIRAQEIIYANQLALATTRDGIFQELESAYKRLKSFSHPSRLRWGFIFALAIANDIIDALDLTVVLAIIAFIVSIVLTLAIFFLIWLGSHKVKRAGHEMKKFDDIAQELRFVGVNQEQIANELKKLQATIGRAAGGVSRWLNKATPINSKLRAVPYKNPVFRFISKGRLILPVAGLGAGIETIPFVDVVNLITAWALISFLLETSAYRSIEQETEEMVVGLEGAATAIDSAIAASI